MARESRFESDSRKLREMGLEPERMTIRERFEALGGDPEGSPLAIVTDGGRKDENRLGGTKKRPSEAVSVALSDTLVNRNPSDTENAQKRALRGPDDATNACSGTKSVDFGGTDEKVGIGTPNTRSVVSDTIVSVRGAAQMALFG